MNPAVNRSFMQAGFSSHKKRLVVVVGGFNWFYLIRGHCTSFFCQDYVEVWKLLAKKIGKALSLSRTFSLSHTHT